jgi:hypothetical protein
VRTTPSSASAATTLSRQRRKSTGCCARCATPALEQAANDDDKLVGLAEAYAGAARELARIDGAPDGGAATVADARSSIWRGAIDRRLSAGNGPQALALFGRVHSQLSPADRLSLDTPLQVVRLDQEADNWIARQDATDARPLQQRIDADPDLSPDARHVVRAKVDARDTDTESARVAKVQELDDGMVAAAGTIATRPGAYAPGTLAKIADGYAAAGEPDKAALARRMAMQEGFVLPFAQASAEKQQSMIDDLPEGELRDSALAIQRHQADAFARDAFAAGTALYRQVGAPVPIDDVPGRVRQARQIAQRRGGIAVAPFTAGEIDDMHRTLAEGTEQEKQAVRARLDAVPVGMRPAAQPIDGIGSTASESMAPQDSSMRTFRLDAAPGTLQEPASRSPSGASPAAELSPSSDTYRAAQQDVQSPASTPMQGSRGTAPSTEPASGSTERQAADTQLRRLETSDEVEHIDTERTITRWMTAFRPDDARPKIPAELERRLSPRQKADIEAITSGKANTATDRAALREIMRALTSSNADERMHWARMPLYHYRPFLSADDFSKVAMLQHLLSPQNGFPREGIGSGGIASLQDALAPDPDSWYGQILPIAWDEEDGFRPALPSSVRSGLKGFLDLVGAIETGSLTPEAIQTLLFGGLASGGIMAPRGALAAGGARRDHRGLPMDTESRLVRAQEQGFRTLPQTYHGTHKRIVPGFSLDPPSRSTKSPMAPTGVWTAENPEAAAFFADHSARTSSPRGQNVLPLWARAENVGRITARKDMDLRAIAVAIEEAWARGHDAVVVKNFPLGNRRETFWVFKDPSQLRSPHAAFDPAKRDSNNLLAGKVVPVPVSSEPSTAPLPNGLLPPHKRVY